MIGKLLSPIINFLQRSSVRPVILRRLLKHDNFVRHWITFFAQEDGQHPKHRLTKYHDFFLDNIERQDTVLDIGCGRGYLAKKVAIRAQKVIGIDNNEDYLEYAKANYAHPNLEFIFGDITSCDFPTNIDVGILSNVLEHIDDRITFLRRIEAVTTKLLVRVPMIDRDWVVILKKEMGIEHRLDPTHFTEYTELQFRQEVSQTDWRIEMLTVRFGEIYAVLTNNL